MQALSQEDADEALLFLWVALSDVDGSYLGGRRAAWNDDAGANGDDNNAGSVAVEFAGFTVASTDCGDLDGDGDGRWHGGVSGVGDILRCDGDELHRAGCPGNSTVDERGYGGATTYSGERHPHVPCGLCGDDGVCNEHLYAAISDGGGPVKFPDDDEHYFQRESRQLRADGNRRGYRQHCSGPDGQRRFHRHNEPQSFAGNSGARGTNAGAEFCQCYGVASCGGY